MEASVIILHSSNEKKESIIVFLLKPGKTLQMFEYKSGKCRHFAHTENKVIVNFLWTAVVLSRLWRAIWLFLWWMETAHFDQISLWKAAACLLAWSLDIQILAHKLFQCLWGMGHALDCFSSRIFTGLSVALLADIVPMQRRTRSGYRSAQGNNRAVSLTQQHAKL